MKAYSIESSGGSEKKTAAKMPVGGRGKKDDVDRERCWYVQKGCLLEETKAKGMERGGVKDSANGIAMK